LENYIFEQYLADYRLEYSATELPARRTLFENELQRIRAHNTKNLSWKEGVSKFTAMTADEKKKFFGRSKGVAAADKKSMKLRELPADFTLQSVDKLPRHVDWRNTGIVSPVKDQGYCGSCW